MHKSMLTEVLRRMKNSTCFFTVGYLCLAVLQPLLINLAYSRWRTPFVEMGCSDNKSSLQRGDTVFSLDMTYSSSYCFICCSWNSMAASQFCIVVGFRGNFTYQCVWVHVCRYLEPTDSTLELRQSRMTTPLHTGRPWTELSLWLTVMTVSGNGCVEDCGEDEGHIGPNLEGRCAACRPPWARVIVPMCSALGHIPWGIAHTGGHLKAYLHVAAIRVRRSTQGSNLFQLLERASVGETEMRIVFLCMWGGWGGGLLWLHLDKVMVSQELPHGYPQCTV